MHPRIPGGLLAACLLLARLAGETAPPAPVVPRLTHPGAGQVVYFVLTDRFADGDPANNRGGLPGGPDDHGYDPARISHFHGGDLAGLTAHLEYIRHLGATAIWVTPPFVNKPMQRGSAGYHGYWILDFLHVDPHLGTDADFAEFVRQAHARGLRVYLDIVVNHTADVIQYADGNLYRDKATFPCRDADGRPFDERAVAWNGLGDPAAFPALSAERSFAHRPVVPPAEAHAKNPAWLNDPTLYHNRGDATFVGESSTLGDFGGLDDLFTEHPRVVQGFIAIFTHWLETYGVDGFRIDTVKHVDGEFWQAFAPAIRARARALGRPDFIQFGEVYNEAGDPAFLSEFSTALPLDATLDFGFLAAARRYVSQAGPPPALAAFFAGDDAYTDHDSNVHATPTFLGNHDVGRFAYFLQQDNPGAPPAQLAELVELGHGLLFLARGQPVLYYGDEQGMIGRGGGDMQAREDMFAARAPEFRDAPLLATTRTGADEKFDEAHPFFRFFERLATLRAAHPALRTGAMLPRLATTEGLFAFSRLERGERIEYLAVFNNSRSTGRSAEVPTSQPAGAPFRRLFDSRAPDAASGPVASADARGRLAVALAPLQFAVWRAERPLPVPVAAPSIALTAPAEGGVLQFGTYDVDGQTFVRRKELRAEVDGGDGVAEVTFALGRASRPNQYEYLGTDDTPPYRVFWSPPPDLAPDDELTFLATVTDLRGHTATARADHVRVAPGRIAGGLRGATVPVITSPPPATVTLAADRPLVLAVAAEGTAPLEYQWFHDDAAIPGAAGPTLQAPAAAGRYFVLVHSRAGTAISRPTEVVVAGPANPAQP